MAEKDLPLNESSESMGKGSRSIDPLNLRAVPVDQSKETFSTSKPWLFLNSPFGLFLLTTLLISGVGGWLTQHQKNAERDIALHEQEKELLFEFDFRLLEVDARAEQIRNATTDLDRGTYTIYIYQAAYGANDFRPTQQKFQNVPLAGIASELASLGICGNTQQVIAAVRELVYSPVEVRNSANRDVFPPGFVEGKSKLLHEYSERAWNQVGGRAACR